MPTAVATTVGCPILPVAAQDDPGSAAPVHRSEVGRQEPMLGRSNPEVVLGAHLQWGRAMLRCYAPQTRADPAGEPYNRLAWRKWIGPNSNEYQGWSPGPPAGAPGAVGMGRRRAYATPHSPPLSSPP